MNRGVRAENRLDKSVIVSKAGLSFAKSLLSVQSALLFKLPLAPTMPTAAQATEKLGARLLDCPQRSFFPSV